MTRPGDKASQEFALQLGASWAGDSTMMPPKALDAALIFAPIGDLVPAALSASKKGAQIICAGIHMSDIPSFAYDLLWGERSIKSVANLTRQDGVEFMSLAASMRIQAQTKTYPLSQANQALQDLRNGKITGAAVLIPELG